MAWKCGVGGLEERLEGVGGVGIRRGEGVMER